MSNRWRFADLHEGGCPVDFHVNFEFRSRLLGALIGVLLHDAVRCMVVALEARAWALYGAEACSSWGAEVNVNRASGSSAG